MHARSSNSADPVIDLLGQFLRDLRPAEASYCRAEVTRPWGIDLQFQKGIRFHFVAEGTCWANPDPKCADEGHCIKGNRLLGRVRRPLIGAFALSYRLSPTAAPPQGGCGRQVPSVGFNN
ncbi:MAG: AraC family transcriptional regulator [Mesorhizobium sp.]|nr:MAG: AraC family transcriptional regulator [Mesorhizobium sp.]